MGILSNCLTILSDELKNCFMIQELILLYCCPLANCLLIFGVSKVSNNLSNNNFFLLR